MAKIKISGKQDLVDVSEDRARQIVDIWEDDSIPGSAKLTIDGNIICKSDIKGVFREKEQHAPKVDNQELYIKGREELLKLTPRQRAEKTWGHFSLLYWAINRRVPPEDIKEEVFSVAEKFFNENQEYTKVKLKTWAEYLNMDKNTRVYGPAFTILEKAELSEADIVSAGAALYNPLKQ